MTAIAAASSRRWTLSFADLCLVLLGFMLLLQAQRSGTAAMGAGIRAAFGAHPPAVSAFASAALFQPGEALLRAPAHDTLAAIGRRAAAGGATVTIESVGMDGGARRFDAWELAAARAAAVARAVADGGLGSARIDVAVAGMRAGGRGQKLTITTAPRAS